MSPNEELKQFRDTQFFVSSTGVVISRYPMGGHKGNSSNKERVVGTGGSKGYCEIKTRRGEWWTVHQMVMELYGSPKPGEGYIIDHIDEVKNNNNIENLQWLTIGENVAKTIKLTRRGCVLTVEQANDIRARYKPRIVTILQLAAEYGVSAGTIKDVIKGRYY